MPLWRNLQMTRSPNVTHRRACVASTHFEALRRWVSFFYHAVEQGQKFFQTISSNIRFAWSNSRARLATSAFFCSSSSPASVFTCNGPGPKPRAPNLRFASALSGNEEFAGSIRLTSSRCCLFLLLTAATVGHQRHALFLLRPRHASADASQSRSKHVLHNQRRVLDAGD